MVAGNFNLPSFYLFNYLIRNFNNKIMKIFVKAKPLAKEEKIEKIDEINFIVAVKEPPKGGKANRAITKALALYFNVAPSQVRLVSGSSSRQKVFEILL